MLEEELKKVEAFFDERLRESTRVFEDLKREDWSICISLQQPTPCSEVPFLETCPTGSPASSINYELMKANRKNNKNLKNSFKALKFATSEFYLYLVHVKHFQQLNFEGFRKILKKFDKVFKSSRGDLFQEARIKSANFYTDQKVLTMTLSVEDIYVKIFFGGDRSKGMKNLRVPAVNRNKVKINSPSFSFGFFSSGCLFLFVIVLYSLISGGFLPQNKTHFNIFSGLTILSFYIMGFGLNLFGWGRASVNHVLIFEIDPRDYVNYIQCIASGFQLMLITLIGVLFYLIFSTDALALTIISISAFAGSLLLIVLPIILFPVTSKLWTFKRILFNFATPLFPIRFADFWIFDQLCSLSPPLVLVLFYGPCLIFKTILKSSEENCIKHNLSIPTILIAFPHYVRFMQCCRRFRDFYCAKQVELIHAFNALKYLSSILVIILYECYRAQPENSKDPYLYWTALVVRFLSIVYLIFWDIWVDWGFFGSVSQLKTRKLHRWLRPNVVYSHRSLYYLALVQDIVVRLLALGPAIVEKYVTNASSLFLLYFPISINFLEIIRRVIWNFFRLENEHLNNVGQFRIVRDTPIPHISPLESSRQPASLSHSKDSYLIPSFNIAYPTTDEHSFIPDTSQSV